jgi:hypothetical protein
MTPKFDAIPLIHTFSLEGYSSSVLFRPRRPRQLRRRVGLPTGSASLESLLAGGAELAVEGVGEAGGSGESADFRSAGGLGAERPLLVPLVELEAEPELARPPTRRRVGVRRVLLSADDSAAGASDSVVLAAAVFRAAGLPVRVVGARRARGLEPAAEVAELEGDLRVLERRAVAALVAALSSPLGEAASSETSGLDEAVARVRDCARVIHNPVNQVLLNF